MINNPHQLMLKLKNESNNTEVSILKHGKVKTNFFLNYDYDFDMHIN